MKNLPTRTAPATRAVRSTRRRTATAAASNRVGSIVTAVLLACVFGTTVFGCSQGWNRPRKPPVSGIWIGADSSPLSPEAYDLLRQVHLDEVFYEAATVVWEGDRAQITSRFGDRAPARTPVTLVIRGDSLPPGPNVDQAAESLTAGLRALDLEAQAAGLLPLGFHLDFSSEPSSTLDLAGYSRILRSVRKSVGEKTFLSVSLYPDWLDLEEGRAVADAADFVVAFLYGEEAGGVEDPSVWSFLEVEKRLDRLAEMKVDYLLGVKTVGVARLSDRNGNRLQSTGDASISELVDARDFERPLAGALDLLDRQRVVYEASRRTRFGSWKVAAGQRIEIVRPTTWHFRQLQKLAMERQADGCLGLLAYRLASPVEEMALSVGNLARALVDQPIEPEFEVTVAVTRRTRGGLGLRLGVENLGEEVTDLGGVETNFLQLLMDDRDGYIRTVQSGDFRRYRLFRDGESEVTTGRWRRPDELRLYTPFLGAHDRAMTDEILLVTTNKDPVLTISGSFVIPGGTVYEIESLRGPLSTLSAGRAPE